VTLVVRLQVAELEAELILIRKTRPVQGPVLWVLTVTSQHNLTPVQMDHFRKCSVFIHSIPPNLVENVPARGSRVGTRWSLKVPSNPNHSVLLWFMSELLLYGYHLVRVSYLFIRKLNDTTDFYHFYG